MAGSSDSMKYVRRECIDAVEEFMGRVGQELAYVSVDMDSTYYSSNNRFTKGGRTGALLGIELGGNDRDRTCYTFRMRDLSNPDNWRAKSLRYVPDRGKPPVSARWSMSTAGRGDAEPLEGQEEKLYRATSLMANSMSFGPMFEGWVAAVPGGTLEERELLRILDAKAAAGGKWSAVREELGKGGGMGPMAAWGLMGLNLEKEAKAGRLDWDDPVKRGNMTAMARDAMGLGHLYSVLEEADARIAADPSYEPDLSELLDPDTERGQGALRGLLCLSAYKEIRDHGGMYAKDDRGQTVLAVRDDAAHRGVYDRLTFTRADAELRAAALEANGLRRGAMAKAQCVNKTYAGTSLEEGQSADGKEIRKYQAYRMFRCAVLGEDPDGPSGRMRATMDYDRKKDPGKLSARDIMVDFGEDGPGGLDLQSFLSAAAADPDGAYGRELRKMPAMWAAARQVGGADRICKRATSAFGRQPGAGGVDLMYLEMGEFQDKTQGPRLMAATGPDGTSGAMLAGILQENYARHMGRTPRLVQSIDEAAGRPCFEKGLDSFGKCWEADLVAQALPGGFSDSVGRSAMTFLKEDLAREAVLRRTGERAMEDAEAAWPAESAVGSYKRAVAAFVDEQDADLARGSAMLNDFIVLTSCYGIRDRAGIEYAEADVRDAYGGAQGAARGTAFYRPVSKEEESALSKAYAASGASYLQAVCDSRLQGTEDGFLSACWKGANAAPAPEMKAEALSKAASALRQAAADKDTLWDRRLGYLADRVEGPQLSAKEYARQKAEQEADQDGRGRDDRSAEVV